MSEVSTITNNTTLPVNSAITGKLVYELQPDGQEQVDNLFARAREAADELRRTPLEQRQHAVEQVMDYVRDNRERIVDRICEETGKTRTDALVSEILGVLDNLEWNVHNARKILKDQKIPTPITLMGKKSRVFHEPFGVILKIAPWNYPFHIAMTFSLGAFLAGNAVILKPSEQTPLHGLLEEIFNVAPLIKRSVQVAYGNGMTAQQLIAARPDKIFFTGSTRTGKRILRQAADLLIPAEMELGGKDQMIVFEDVNLKRTVGGAVWGALTNAGQSCTSVERLYIHDSIYDEFVQALVTEVEKLVVNNGDRGDSDIGAITAGFQLDIIEQHVEDARSKGASILTGGARLGDNFYLPTVITNITPDMALHSEETFGPLIPVYKFSTEAEVVQETNSFQYGLTASVWSKDLVRAERVARALEVGGVSINNVMLTEGNPALPFGGQKESGFGRAKGTEGLLAFTRSKSVLIDKQSDIIEPNWYPYTKKKYDIFNRLIEVLFTKSPIKLLKLAVTGMKLEGEAKKPRG
ncbi:aldehyde dehydrogenase family protein [Parendozoicomonas haliclonae]|uniref:Aldehyde dehydrogenase n=1 Tax=Parendozoicomonas haliclonae TaxID=1960125 RepID=A0A1X7AQU1_9GAMM|nr:aldehyde dehydrogenase family protein [Parendozoicomonas haliclonae]SMA49777.1 putative succinate-semialdehyde dehydrogenase [NADP(+)] 2 [Parendozoicomonas haliclonae]